MIDLSVITVCWNSAEYIARQIASVHAAADGLVYEHIIIDNGSMDQTVTEIRARFPSVTLVENGMNLGFAAANNKGFAVSSGRYILFLNPDMTLQPGSLKRWIAWMDEHPRTALSGCMLVDTHGMPITEACPRRFPTPLDQFLLVTKLHRWFQKPLEHYRMKGFDAECEQEVDSVRGSCMMARRDFLDQLGFAFDPRYFIWFEDVDVCREAISRDWKVFYTPVVRATDFIGRSFAKRGSWWKRWQFLKSMFIYFWKWRGV